MHAEDPAARLQRQAVASIEQAMRHQRISRAELARRTGTSRGRITHVLRGGNVTVATLARLADAMDVELELRLRPPGGSSSCRCDVAQSSGPRLSGSAIARASDRSTAPPG